MLGPASTPHAPRPQGHIITSVRQTQGERAPAEASDGAAPAAVLGLAATCSDGQHLAITPQPQLPAQGVVTTTIDAARGALSESADGYSHRCGPFAVSKQPWRGVLGPSGRAPCCLPHMADTAGQARGVT